MYYLLHTYDICKVFYNFAVELDKVDLVSYL